ncbi:hypothetical protein K7X08_005810 [Anisodus acutangulus]|uniref:Serine aminopeptidase S33 domain-containing protein n=1 Tax=Anisodus acutangulus TaxID=402998 RepID=A0A9Q1R6Q1_9SOLA|nr:hypothetical protein K7X08_005810 [Anisodus acutangulus]
MGITSFVLTLGGDPFVNCVGTKLANNGYAVVGIDYEGHGRSAGARCYIKRFDNIVNDCSDFSTQEEYREKTRFLYGESMGGAMALLIHKKDPSFWNGVLPVAPMCKISEKVKPHPMVISLLTKVEDVIPRWKIVPTKEVIDSAFKDPVKREDVRGNRLIYQEKPRLKTALEMLRTSMHLDSFTPWSRVTLPFLVLHGEADIVTDPEISKALYEQAKDNIEIVFSDIISWLDKRNGENIDIDNATLIERSVCRATSTPYEMHTISSPVTMNGTKPQRTRPQASYLCGWQGRRMHHHSAM